MKYEILFNAESRGTRKHLVIQQNVYYGETMFYVHSEHESQETAELVKEALEARESKK